MGNSVFLHWNVKHLSLCLQDQLRESQICTRWRYSVPPMVDLWHFQEELFVNCSLLLICNPLKFGDERLPTFHRKTELLHENSGWNTTGLRRQVRVRLAPHACTSPCMGPLHTTLLNFNISSSQQRSSSREEEKPSAK